MDKSLNPLSRSTLLIMAIATGVSVANLYYNQPLLEQMRSSFQTGVREIGWIPSLTQIGYAVGMLFLIPLGDLLERKKLTLIFTLLSGFFMLLAGLSNHFYSFVVISFLIGITTMTPQLLIPFAAHMAPEKERGRVVGTMMSGLLLGVLLARTVSGFIGASLGWRWMYYIAAIVLILLTLMLFIFLPKSEPTFKGSYKELINSVFVIFKEQPILREASFFGAMLFAAFSAFWSTLIHLMESPSFNYGSRAVGLFGLLGAAAAALVPVIGHLTDKRAPRKVTGYMIGLTIISFLVYWASYKSLIGIAIGVILMDVGVQSGHVSNQSRIFALLPHARSRVQTVYMFAYFIGGAVGSWAGTWSWAEMQWTGVCLCALTFLSLAVVRYFILDSSRVLKT